MVSAITAEYASASGHRWSKIRAAAAPFPKKSSIVNPLWRLHGAPAGGEPRAGVVRRRTGCARRGGDSGTDNRRGAQR